MASTSAAKLFNVEGLVAVVTSGGTGIGRFMALALEENDAKVYIIGRRLEVLGKVAKEAKAVDLITQSTGYINLLIANTGIQDLGIGGPDIGSLKPGSSLPKLKELLWQTDSDSYTNMFAINSTAVISTSSIAAYNRVALAGFAYGGTKAATALLIKQFSTIFISYGIWSNVIAPGLYPSEMTDGAIGELKGPDGLLPMAVVPAKRERTKEDMEGAILFLASRAGAYLNGTAVVADGGRLSGLPPSY